MTTLIDARSQMVTMSRSEIPTVSAETTDEESGVQPRGRFRTRITFEQYVAWINGCVDHETMEGVAGFCG